MAVVIEMVVDEVVKLAGELSKLQATTRLTRHVLARQNPSPQRTPAYSHRMSPKYIIGTGHTDN